MYKKTITYEDYNGETRTEDFYFNFNKAELVEMELSTAGGLTNLITKITNAKDGPTIIKIFKKLVLDAYGERSDDGRRFIKSKELSEAFSQTPAYSEIFMELSTDDEAAAKFINGIIPADLAAEVAKEQAKTLSNNAA